MANGEWRMAKQELAAYFSDVRHLKVAQIFNLPYRRIAFCKPT